MSDKCTVMFDNLTHLPYMNWSDWIKSLSKYFIGIHLMRTHAAGTFTLNCVSLGIPCVGYAGLSTQEDLHPELTVEIGDIKSAIEKTKQLNTSEYYAEVVYSCRNNYKKYKESNWLKNWKNIEKEIHNQ